MGMERTISLFDNVTRRAIFSREEVNLLKPRRSHPASVPKLKSHNPTIVRSDKSVLQRGYICMVAFCRLGCGVGRPNVCSRINRAGIEALGDSSGDGASDGETKREREKEGGK